MADVVYFLVTAAFFAATVAYARAIDRMGS